MFALSVCDWSSVTAYKHFVMQLVIDGHLPDPQWKASQLWTDDYLKSKAVCADASYISMISSSCQFFQLRYIAMRIKKLFIIVVIGFLHRDTHRSTWRFGTMARPLARAAR